MYLFYTTSVSDRETAGARVRRIVYTPIYFYFGIAHKIPSNKDTATGTVNNIDGFVYMHAGIKDSI